MKLFLNCFQAPPGRKTFSAKFQTKEIFLNTEKNNERNKKELFKNLSFSNRIFGVGRSPGSS